MLKSLDVFYEDAKCIQCLTKIKKFKFLFIIPERMKKWKTTSRYCCNEFFFFKHKYPILSVQLTVSAKYMYTEVSLSVCQVFLTGVGQISKTPHPPSLSTPLPPNT